MGIPGGSAWGSVWFQKLRVNAAGAFKCSIGSIMVKERPIKRCRQRHLSLLSRLTTNQNSYLFTAIIRVNAVHIIILNNVQ